MRNESDEEVYIKTISLIKQSDRVITQGDRYPSRT